MMEKNKEKAERKVQLINKKKFKEVFGEVMGILVKHQLDPEEMDYVLDLMSQSSKRVMQDLAEELLNLARFKELMARKGEGSASYVH